MRETCGARQPRQDELHVVSMLCWETSAIRMHFNRKWLSINEPRRFAPKICGMTLAPWSILSTSCTTWEFTTLIYELSGIHETKSSAQLCRLPLSSAVKIKPLFIVAVSDTQA